MLEIICQPYDVSPQLIYATKKKKKKKGNRGEENGVRKINWKMMVEQQRCFLF